MREDVNQLDKTELARTNQDEDRSERKEQVKKMAIRRHFKFDDYEVEREGARQREPQWYLPDSTSSTSAESLVSARRNEICVDCLQHPTQLFLRLHYRLWDMAIQAVEQSPIEAKTWLVSNDSMGNIKSKVLPIHVAFQGKQQFPSPRVVETLVKAYPTGLKCRDFQGNLPLHVACENDSLVQDESSSKHTFGILIDEYPESLFLADCQGRVPLRILQELHACQSVLDYIRHKMNDAHVYHHSDGDEEVDESRYPSNQENRETDFASELNRRFMGPSSTNINTSSSPSMHYLGMSPRRDSPPESSSSTGPVTSHEPQQGPSVELPIPRDSHLEFAGPIQASKSWHGESWSITNEDSIGDGDEDESATPSESIGRMALKLAKVITENTQLQRKLSQLSNETQAAKNDLNDRSILMDELKRSHAADRELSQCQIKELQDKLWRANESLKEMKNQMASKSAHETVLAAKIDKLESAVADKKAEKSTLTTALEVSQEEMSNLRTEMKKIKDKLGRKEREADDTRGLQKETAVALVRVKEAETALAKQVEDLADVVEEKETRINDLLHFNQSAEERLARVQKENASLKSALEENTKSFAGNVDSLEQTIKSNFLERERLQNDLKKMKSRLDSSQQHLKVMECTTASLGSENEKLRASEYELRNENSKLVETNEKLKSELMVVRNNNEKLGVEVESLTREREKLNEQVQELLGTILDTKNRLRLSDNTHLEKEQKYVEASKTISEMEADKKAMLNQREQLEIAKAHVTELHTMNATLSETMAMQQQETNIFRQKTLELEAALTTLKNKAGKQEGLLNSIHRKLLPLRKRSEVDGPANEKIANKLPWTLDKTLADQVIATLHQQIGRLQRENESLDQRTQTICKTQNTMAKLGQLDEKHQDEREKWNKTIEAQALEIQRLVVDNSILRGDLKVATTASAEVQSRLQDVREEKNKIEATCLAVSEKLSHMLVVFSDASALDVEAKACIETKELLEGLEILETRLADQVKSSEEETLWLRDVMVVLADFLPAKSEAEGDDTAKEDRVPSRAEVMGQLKKVLKMFRISVRALHKKVKEFETKIGDYNEQLQERSAAYKILAMENSILKSSGKERDTMTRQVREKISEENSHLKRTVNRLKEETKRLKQKYEVLETRQEGLRRKKEVTSDKNLNSKDALQQMRETSLVVDCIESLVSADTTMSDRYASLVDPDLVVEL